MPLTLVTGPANAAKAGEVLGGLRERLDEEPILVVPSFPDVEHNQRELAERGAVFGATVLRFGRLFEEIARRVGYSARVASELQRELILEEAIRGAGLSVLRESSERPGFVRAGVKFVSELERSMVEPSRLTSALRTWAGDGPRRDYAEEVAALYRRYRGGLDDADLVDNDLFAWRALDALRLSPLKWGGTPAFVYGFDDFTPLELDALEVLSGVCEAPVTVSLPYEAGRPAFKAIARIERELSGLAASTVHLYPISDHYAEASRDALHHVERGLFDDEVPQRGDAAEAVRLHRTGGERAEVELVGAEVLRMLREDESLQPGDVAVVYRDPGRYASVVEQVFDAYGIPFSIDRRVPLSHTAVGRGLLALLRSALLEGSAEDLVTYLRTPGRLKEPGMADWLEAEARREGARTAVAARRVWEARHWSLEELDRLAATRNGDALLAELGRQLQRLFSAPYRRTAPVLAGAQLDDPRAYEAARGALEGMGEVGSARRFDARRVHETLSDLEVRVGEDPQPDRVQVADPGAIRARRFGAVFICGLQEGEFPRPATPEPFLPDEDRREIAQASGLVLAMREDQLDRERYLFYVCASRAERTLVLSARYCDEEGNPQAASFFVEDVRDLFGELGERRRALSDVTWELEDAPTAAEWQRAHARRAPRMEPTLPDSLTDPGLLAALAAREALSAGALEAFADCPVKWLVDKLLAPQALEPDPEAMVRGRYAHKVLERTFTRLREETGDRRITPDNLARAEQILVEELRSNREEFPISPKQTRVAAAVRRLEFDLLRYLRHEAERDGEFEPEHLELGFGFDEDDAVEVAEGVRLRGVIDRVDTYDGMALVRDYKTGSSVASYKAASWEDKHRFQAALYMMVVERLFEGTRAVGGVYTALGGEDRRSRGMLAQDVPQLGSDFVKTDWLPPEDFDAKLEGARAAIVETAGSLRRGELRCTPETCKWDGGCSYPSICRVEE